MATNQRHPVCTPCPVRLSEARAPAALAEAGHCTAEQRRESERTAQAHGTREAEAGSGQVFPFLPLRAPSLSPARPAVTPAMEFSRGTAGLSSRTSIWSYFKICCHLLHFPSLL